MAAPESLQHEPGTSEGLGRALRQAREAAGYSPSDVAAQLRLPQSTIEDLEAERFEKFPVPVFARGYLSNYARLLGLPPDPLLDEFDRCGFVPPRVHPQPEARDSGRGSELTVTLVTVIVVIVVFGLGALWWRMQWSERPETPAPVSSGESRSAADGVEEALGAGEPDPSLFDFLEPVRPTEGEDEGGFPTSDIAVMPIEDEPAEGEASPPDEVGDEAVASDASGVEESGAPAAEGADDDAAALAAPGQTATRNATEPERPEEVSDSEPAPGSEGVAASDSAAAAQPPEPDDGAFASLVFRVRDDSWIMVRDARNWLIYSSVAAGGDVLRLSGVAPFQVVAGYPGALEIEYEGEPYDLSPHIPPDGTTARFQIPR